MGSVGRVRREGHGHRGENVGDIRRQRLADFLVADFLVELVLGKSGGELCRRRDPKVGGGFTAWEGYIEGTNVELEPFKRIVQRWRTLEFPVDAPDSLLEILLEPSNGGALLTINHSEIPEGQGDAYKLGWADKALAKTDRNGKLARPIAPVANWVSDSRNRLTEISNFVLGEGMFVFNESTHSTFTQIVTGDDANYTRGC